MKRYMGATEVTRDGWLDRMKGWRKKKGAGSRVTEESRGIKNGLYPFNVL